MHSMEWNGEQEQGCWMWAKEKQEVVGREREPVAKQRA